MGTYRQAFIENDWEIALSQAGFAIVPMLSEEEISQIGEFYQSHQPSGSTGFHSTHFLTDRILKREVHSFLKKIFEPHIDLRLSGFDIRFCNFMVKESGVDSIMPLHTDWTYVEENKHRSLALWCALTDTTEQNGALGVVPGSHKLPVNIRGPQIKTPFHDFNEAIIRHSGKLLEIPAGHAVIYDHRLMHYSPANLSDKRRVAINVILTPREADIKHYCVLDNPDLIHSYNVKEEHFFIEYDAFQAPGGNASANSFSNPHFQFTHKDLRGFLPEEPVLQKKWWQRWLG
jgi:hypothetical protein